MSIVYLVTASFSDYEGADQKIIKAYRDEIKAEAHRLRLEEVLTAYESEFQKYIILMQEWQKVNPYPVAPKHMKTACKEYNAQCREYMLNSQNYSAMISPASRDEFKDICRFNEYCFEIQEVELDEED